MPGTPHRPGRGRKPTPTALRLARGNPSGRPFNDLEPAAVPHLPKPPAFFTAAARREWFRIGRQLVDAGILTDLDRMAFAALIMSYIRWMDAQDGIAKTGVLVRGPDGTPRLNPLVQVARESQREFTSMASEFGLTPST